MEQSLGYLREILAAYTETDKIGRAIFEKITKNDYASEEQFVKELSQEESHYLNMILKEAIDYSLHARDYERAYQLNEVFEQLLI